ncbi:response regulator transcription factor [Paeniglutamicibacter sp. ABSL32-1]|uniref:response regulator transcription factor n=1 Tax=Paeniglutamicibacter quisquiliarum TaxID=2849498 RepID=UPI001C2DEA8B|nr:response regulator transcription factor [Paeniglutamicibacter quisquiliarum]MBV1781244.1 response regulator transcription factor [Paeniglutamicibacter quisquiliarum]
MTQAGAAPGTGFRAALQSARRASAQRDHARAAFHFTEAIAAHGRTPEPGIPLGGLHLELAGAHFHAGDVASAWRACESALALARETGNGALLADTATVLQGISDRALAARVHALCIEALALLGDGDPVRRSRLRAQLAATGDEWQGDRYFDLDTSGPDTATTDPEAEFIAMQADHARFVSLEHVEKRLDVARRATALGRRIGNDDYTAWGLLWRVEAFAQLGRIADLTEATAVLEPLVQRLRDGQWLWRMSMIRAVLLHLEGRFDEARATADRALAARGATVDESAAMTHLVMVSSIAGLTGTGLDEAEAGVRRIVDFLPYFAKGWLAEVLLEAGRREESRALWQAIVPHLDEVRSHTAEWIVATTTHADLCVAFGDRATGARLYGELLPFARFQASSLNSRHYAKQATELMERLPDLPRQLSAREEEVAGLLARGLSNRAIAERLYLSERTVENHASSALRKLGFSSRSEIAVWHALNRQPDISARDGRGSTGQE